MSNHTFEENHKPEEENFLLDVRETTNHPLSNRYSEIYKACLLNCSPDILRSQPGFSLSGSSPFVNAIKQVLNHDNLDSRETLEKVEKIFSKYYEMVQVKDASEWFGLENQYLMKQPPWGAVYPWRARSIDSYRNSFERAALHENEAIGYDGVDITEGWLFNGPVTRRKVKIESERMLYILKRINKYGYQRSNENDGDPKATALVNENGEYRCVLTGGNHRASVASALGFKKIPIRVNLVIRRDEVDFWPQVVDQIFTRNEALKVFDIYFNATPPNYTLNWCEFINKNK